MDEFEFPSDPITDDGVSCPRASENYTFTRFSLLFLFRSFKHGQITRTRIISYVFELISGHCFSSSELPAFEHRRCLQTLCWLHGERSLLIGILVYLSNRASMKPENLRSRKAHLTRCHKNTNDLNKRFYNVKITLRLSIEQILKGPYP